ncbi:MAG: Asp-tRNA(Asn)/Glu-tRNA(Gln) amidotransferase subunit GatC [Candidatus Diapherotrites archaeon]|uniref:Aspartyl/glutamyl-tRNA(Asn/Gln) amidotransferase subunit C n=1 Tax=Candidatus Iainarchaeum sp. TaxID=3101447 RepID=A0A938YU21_9ARCH|nr:Asp-tRNA(Asn)/Glu-tRNA(Gln) amidotransferase subunit GatC [Candidatus Diapherotrites archaeon]
MPKQKVDKALLLRVAANARLNLTEQEIEEFLPQLQEMLEAFSKLDKLDVEKEQPSFQPIKLVNVMREDKVEKCLSQDQSLKNTKNKKQGYFMGPRVM